MRTKEYANIHYWIRRNYGSPKICESLTCDGVSIVFDWARKTGVPHKRDRTHYLRLCRRCHMKYDWTPKKSKHMSRIGRSKEVMDRRAKALRGVPKSDYVKECVGKAHRIPVVKVGTDGKRTKYSSMSQAAIENNVTCGSISLILSRKNNCNRKGEIYVYDS